MSEFIDGELDRPLRHLVEQHLEDCKACRVCMATLKRTIALCRHSDRPRLPEEVSARLARMIANLPEK